MSLERTFNMSNSEIFSTAFVTRVTETLNSNCPEGTGQRITRTSLATVLQLPKEYEATLGAMVKHNVLPGWESFKGVNGGIGRSGEKPAKKASTNSGPNASDEFVAQVTPILERLCIEGASPVPRKDIAMELGDPGSKTEALISAALKRDELSGIYEAVRGKKGGIRLIVEADESTADESTDIVEDNASSDADYSTDTVAAAEASDYDAIAAAVEAELGEELTDSMEEADQVDDSAAAM
jgi:DNA-binding IscR family transcriptional regulator